MTFNIPVFGSTETLAVDVDPEYENVYADMGRVVWRATSTPVATEHVGVGPSMSDAIHRCIKKVIAAGEHPTE